MPIKKQPNGCQPSASLTPTHAEHPPQKGGFPLSFHPVLKLPKFFRTLLTALAVAVLSVALTFLMHNQDTFRTGFWDDYSQSLVFARILQMQQDQSAPGGFLGSYTGQFGDTQNRYLYRENTPVTPDQYLSYTHQSGLQGLGFGVLNKVFSVWQDNGEARERMLYAANSILFYAVSLCLCIGLWRTFGAPAAMGWMAAVLLSPWVQRGMKDLYWCLWTWLLPALAGLILCAATKKRHTTPSWAYFLVFAAVCVRCMCGFEFISAFLILAEVPPFLCWVLALGQKRPARGWFFRMVRTGFAALAGVAAALAVWLVQSCLYFGTWAGAWDNVVSAALRHTTGGTATAAAMLDRYFVQGEAVLQLGPVGITPPVWLGICAAFFVLAAVVLAVRRRALPPAYAGLAALFLLGLAAPISWMVLAPAHCEPHPHLIPMLWNFAFAPAGAAAIGGLLRLMVQKSPAPAAAAQPPAQPGKEDPHAGTP